MEDHSSNFFSINHVKWVTFWNNLILECSHSSKMLLLHLNLLQDASLHNFILSQLSFVCHSFIICLSSKTKNGKLPKLMLLMVPLVALFFYPPKISRIMMYNQNLSKVSMVHHFITQLLIFIGQLNQETYEDSAIWNLAHKSHTVYKQLKKASKNS